MRSYENKNGRDALNSVCKTDSCSEKSECFSYKIWINRSKSNIFFKKKVSAEQLLFFIFYFQTMDAFGP